MSDDAHTPDELEAMDNTLRFLTDLGTEKKTKRVNMPPQQEGDNHRRFKLVWQNGRPAMIEVEPECDGT